MAGFPAFFPEIGPRVLVGVRASSVAAAQHKQPPPPSACLEARVPSARRSDAMQVEAGARFQPGLGMVAPRKVTVGAARCCTHRNWRFCLLRVVWRGMVWWNVSSRSV